jgi:hypothetical protein
MKTKLQDDWLNYFRLACYQAAKARLLGQMQTALALDRTVNQYYAEGKAHGFNEDTLFEIESDTRSNTTVHEEEIIL